MNDGNDRTASAGIDVGLPAPDDEAAWTAWIESLLDAAAERITSTQREMQARGILDEEGTLLSGALPADMTPGS